MPRSDWESKLIRLQFDDSSEEIDEAFDDLLRAGKSRKNIIGKLFSIYADSLRHICVDAATTLEEEDRAVAGELTSPDAVWKHLCHVHRFREHLLSMSDLDLAAAYRESWKANYVASAIRTEAAGRRRDAFEFFNEPEADADYGFWLKVGVWTIEEAVALSLGKNPRVVRSETLFISASQKSSPFRDEFKKRLFLLERAQQGGLVGEPLRRDVILEWLTANNIAAPPELSINENDYDLQYWKFRCLDIEESLEKLRANSTDDNWQIGGKPKRTTVYKLLLGMALCAYGHRFDGGSPAPLAIERDLGLLREQSEDDLKLSVGDDRIRDILSDAANMLSASWRGHLDVKMFEAWKQRNRGS